MKEKKICQKCGREERVRNGFNRGKQRYKCKNCGCNYTGGRNGYPDHIKQKAIQYHLEGNEFRRIERLIHVLVINWVKKATEGIRKSKVIKNRKVDILELDKIYVNLKKYGCGWGSRKKD